MKAYQLSILMLTLAPNAGTCVPQVPFYGSRYPQHPQNLGYGPDYAKYWQGEAYIPPDSHHQRPVFYPYPYSQAWKPVGPVAIQEQPSAHLPEKKPVYTPPHKFPIQKSPAKEAIAAYSGSKYAVTSPTPESSKSQALARAPQCNYGPALRHEKGGKNMNIGDKGSPSDDTVLTKIISNPSSTSSGILGSEDGTQWDQFSCGAVSDTLVLHNPHETEGEIAAPSERRTNAMAKIQKMLGNERWHEKRDMSPHPDNQWPEHIRTKAERMMKSASAMQQRGQKKMEEDTKVKESSKSAPTSHQDEIRATILRPTAEIESGPTIPTAPSAQAKFMSPQGPFSPPVIGPISKFPSHKVPVTMSPQRKDKPNANIPQGKCTSNPPQGKALAVELPHGRNAAPPATCIKLKNVPGPKKPSVRDASKQPASRTNNDPMMREELPRPTGAGKKPKKPKNRRPPPEQQPIRIKPAHGRKGMIQENSPLQTRRKPNTVSALRKRDEPRITGLEKLEVSSGGKVGAMGQRSIVSNGKPQVPHRHNDQGGKVPQYRNAKKGTKDLRPRQLLSTNQDYTKKKAKPENKGKLTERSQSPEERVVRPSIISSLEIEYGAVRNDDGRVSQQSIDNATKLHLGKRRTYDVFPYGQPVTIRRILRASTITPALAPPFHRTETLILPVAPTSHLACGSPCDGIQYGAAYQIPDGQIQHICPLIRIPPASSQIAAVRMPQRPAVTTPSIAYVTRCIEKSVHIAGPTRWHLIPIEKPESARTVSVGGSGPTKTAFVERIVQQPPVVVEKTAALQRIPFYITQTLVQPTATRVVPTPPIREAAIECETKVIPKQDVRPVKLVENIVTNAVADLSGPAVHNAVLRPISNRIVQETTVNAIARPGPIQAVERKPIARPREHISYQPVIREKTVCNEIEICTEIPVTTRKFICPACEEEEASCHCDLSPFRTCEVRPSGGEGVCIPQTVDGLPRTAQELEAFFRAYFPDEFKRKL